MDADGVAVALVVGEVVPVEEPVLVVGFGGVLPFFFFLISKSERRKQEKRERDKVPVACPSPPISTDKKMSKENSADGCPPCNSLFIVLSSYEGKS